MEIEFSKRRKGSDKKKERYDRNGKFSTKHLRLKNEQIERKVEQKSKEQTEQQTEQQIEKQKKPMK